MDIRAACERLACATASEGSRDATLHAARQLVVDECLAALGQEPRGGVTIAAAVRMVAETNVRAAQRGAAFLVIHAFGVPGLIPSAANADVCTLAEAGLNSVLLRCSYPFAGSVAEKTDVLQRLHRTIGELMQPLEPTFPNWQGLYAG